MKLTINYLIMKIFFFILILAFNLQSWTKADDIRDFEIEGISIGDSALKYFDKKILENNKEYEWYEDKSYIPIAELKLSDSKIYESFQIHVKNNDNKYIIESVAGFIFFKDSINQCYKKLDSIVNEIESLFNDIENLGKSSYKHSFDKTGKSTITDIILRDNNGFEISIQCYDWSKDLPYTDQLRIVIDSKKFSDWMRKIN